MIEILITSSVLITVIAILRLVLRGRIRPGLQYALWGLVLLRLLVPVSWFHSPISVAGAAETAIEEVESLSARPVSELPVRFIPAPPDVSAFAREPSFWDNISLEALAIALWITGAILLGLWFAYVNFRLAAKLYRERLLYSTDHPAAVYVVQNLPSPCLFGGEVYLTEDAAADPARAEYIIAHELTHRRHGDGLWSALRVCCLAVYWFNPFVWLAATLSRRDCEIFCDAATVKKLGEEHRFDYGRTLLDMTAVKLRPSDLICSATTMSGSGRTLRERIKRIACQPKASVILCIAAVLIAAIAVGCTFSGTKETAELSAPISMSAAQPDPPVYLSTERADLQDEHVNALMENELYQYYMEYLAALGDNTWDKAAEYCWMDSEYSKSLSMEHHKPIVFASMIAFQRLSDDFIAVLMDMQMENRGEPQEVLNFVGRVDGKPCVFRNADNIPQPLQDSLQYLQLTPDIGAEESMSIDSTYYDEVAAVFGPFLEPNLERQLDRGGGYEVGPAPFDVTFEEFVYMTDSWEFTYYDDPIRLDLDSEGPSAIFSITAKDGTELYIFSDAGLYIGRNWEYSVHATLGDLTGDEMIAMLYNWASGELNSPAPSGSEAAGLSPIPDRGTPSAREEAGPTAAPVSAQNVYPTAIPTPTPKPAAAAVEPVFAPTPEPETGSAPGSTPAPIRQEADSRIPAASLTESAFVGDLPEIGS